MRKISPRCSILLVAALFALSSLREAQAQGEPICSPEEVQNAIDQLECVADGVYLSPETAARAVGQVCARSLTRRGCRRCFLVSGRKLFPAFNTLIHLEMLDRGQLRNLRSALAVEMRDVCGSPAQPTAIPTPPAEETPVPTATATPTTPPEDTPPPEESPIPTPEPTPSLTPEPTPTAIDTPFGQPPAYPTPITRWRDSYRYPGRWH